MKTLSFAPAAALLFAVVGTAAHAGTVALSGFKWGSEQVKVVNEPPGSPSFGSTTVLAGAFTGAASGFAEAWVNGALITYCVEFTETFRFGSLNGYSVVEGSSYGHFGVDAAAISNRLGSLMSHVDSLTGGAAVDTAAESAAVQLAIWETIYEKPVGVNLALDEGNFRELNRPVLRGAANALLAGSAGVASRYDVFVLSKAGSQDWILLRERDPDTSQGVPEPGTLALVAAALGAAGLTMRRRRALPG